MEIDFLHIAKSTRPSWLPTLLIYPTSIFWLKPLGSLEQQVSTPSGWRAPWILDVHLQSLWGINVVTSNYYNRGENILGALAWGWLEARKWATSLLFVMFRYIEIDPRLCEKGRACAILFAQLISEGRVTGMGSWVSATSATVPINLLIGRNVFITLYSRPQPLEILKIMFYPHLWRKAQGPATLTWTKG